LDQLSALLLGTPLPSAARENLLSSLKTVDEADLPAIVVAGLVASPAFQWR
jgi:hypothetical protein